MAEDERRELPRAAVDRELEKAEQALEDATKARAADISKATIVTRLSYACFHGAQAALYAHGWNPQSHGQVQTWFGRELVQPGVVPRAFGRFLNDMETYRRRVEYGTGGVEAGTEQLLERTSAFVAAMREAVGDDPTG